SGRPSISSVGTWPTGLSLRKSCDCMSLALNDIGFASKGTPISCSAICTAIELEPGAKYSVSMVFNSFRHCEERSDEAIQDSSQGPGLLRFARNDASTSTN